MDQVQRGLFPHLGDTIADDEGAPPADIGPTETLRPVGRYVVLEHVGRGGMGTVIRAYDPKLHREVALKRVNSTALSAETKTRLMREAQAMARLSHPCVVGVHDVELTGDDVVLVMEYVRGQTLGSWLSSQRPSWREILSAFRSAGEGLAAAHREGVIHRDFKPSNVMVAEDGSVKVTDFGLAKGDPARDEVGETSEPSTEDWRDGFASPLTRDDTVLGTPRYMAPEQHAGSADERADQFAFCVALWEALCGTPPYGARSLSALAAAKMKGPPGWPASGRAPRRIVGAIRRGLAPSPEDRWPSMGALLSRLSESSRRQWAFISVATVGVVATIGTAVASQVERASLCTGARAQLAGVWDEEQRTRLRQAFASTELRFAAATLPVVEEELDRYASAWVTSHRDACEATSVRGEQSSEVMDLRMACLGGIRRELAAATVLLTHADRDIAEHAVDLVGALPLVRRCDDVAALRSAIPPPSDPREREAVGTLRRRIANARALYEAGRFADALAELDDGRETMESLDYPPVRAEWKLVRGRVLGGAGQYTQAADVLRDGLAEAMQTGAWPLAAEVASVLASTLASELALIEEGQWTADLARSLASGAGDHEDGLAKALFAEATVAAARRDYERAERALVRALEVRRAALGEEHPAVRSTELRLAGVLGRRGKYDEGEAMVRTVLDARRRTMGADHPQVAAAQNILATLLLEQARYAEAVDLFREAIASGERTLGKDHAFVARTYSNLGLALYHHAEYDEAERLLRLAYERGAAALGPRHPDTSNALNNLGLALTAQEKYAEAEEVLRETLQLREEIGGSDHPNVATCALNLGNVLLDIGEHREAEALFRRALSIWERRFGPEHPLVGKGLNNLGLALANQGRHPEAEVTYRRALEIADRALHANHRVLGKLRHNLGEALVEQGEMREALPVLEEAWEIRQRAENDPLYRAQSAFLLARARRGSGDEPGARELAEHAQRELRQAREQIDRPGVDARELEVAIGRFLRTKRRHHQPK